MPELKKTQPVAPAKERKMTRVDKIAKRMRQLKANGTKIESIESIVSLLVSGADVAAIMDIVHGRTK